MCGAEKNRFKVLGKRLNTSQGMKPKKKAGISTTIMKCLNCGLIFSNPQPIPENIQDHYKTPPEDFWKKSYFVESDDYFNNEIKWLKKLSKIEKGAQALDVGSGIGKCMKVLEREGFETFGIEPSQAFYQRAIEKMGISPQKLKLTSIEDAQFPNNSFIFITMIAVLEHLPDPSCAIQKILKWLMPGGLIFIEVTSSSWLINRMANLYYKIIGSDYVANLSPLHIPYHLYEFSLNSFKKHSEVYNYKIIHQEYYVCQTYMPKYFNFFLKPVMKYSNTGMQLCLWLTRQ